MRKFFGIAGVLAAGNINRSRRRVLTTTMSMVVGLAVIAAMSVFADSYRATLADSLDSD